MVSHGLPAASCWVFCTISRSVPSSSPRRCSRRRRCRFSPGSPRAKLTGRRRPAMFRKILVANDGSPGAFAALQGAIDLAVTYRAELHMISVEEIPHLAATIDDVEAEREAAAHRSRPRVEP